MTAVSSVLLAVTLFAGAAGQTAGDKPAFDVASVKPNKSTGEPTSNFPLGPGNVYVPNGGYFSAANYPLVTYILFAYKISGYQSQALIPQLPAWVTTDRFDIQARVKGNPTKDEMRLLMQSLLADRFKLAIHTATREVPAFGVLLVKAGKTGPLLQPHPDGASCSSTASDTTPPLKAAGKFPTLCGGIFNMPPSAPGRVRVGARNVGMGVIASALTLMGNLGRPVMDQTGLSGNFDFAMEWTIEPDDVPPGVDFQPDPSGPSFQAALKDQLGLRLESQKGSAEVIVVDHVERPTEN
jgi:uncharacterized protein (TIGR03435 family)